MTAVQVQTWRHAASDLCVEFISPFGVDTGVGRIEYFGYLPKFGSPRGMVVVVGPYTPAHLEAAKDRGFGYACLSEDAAPYDRDSFIEMLSDWGWTGRKEESPSW